MINSFPFRKHMFKDLSEWVRFLVRRKMIYLESSSRPKRSWKGNSFVFLMGNFTNLWTGWILNLKGWDLYFAVLFSCFIFWRFLAKFKIFEAPHLSLFVQIFHNYLTLLIMLRVWSFVLCGHSDTYGFIVWLVVFLWESKFFWQLLWIIEGFGYLLGLILPIFLLGKTLKFTIAKGCIFQ